MSESKSSFPVVMSDSLRNLEVYRQFATMSDAKLRMSNTVQKGVCVFPKSSVAFLLVDSNELRRLEVDRVKRFVHVHRPCYLLLQVQVMDNSHMESVIKLQTRLFPDVCPLLFSDGPASTVQQMLFTANAHLPTTIALSVSAVKEFSDKSTADEIVVGIVSSLEESGQLTSSSGQCHALSSGALSLAELSTASIEDMVAVGVDPSKANRLSRFFQQDHFSEVVIHPE